MNSPLFIGLLIAWLAAAAVGGWFVRRQLLSLQSRRRVADATLASEDELLPSRPGRLRRWLHRAGLRSPEAVPIFLICVAVSLAVAAGLIATFLASGIVETLDGTLRLVPGGVGEVFLPAVWAAPWIAGLLIATLPFLYVRDRRRRRVASVEQDLPVFLDLISTLAEAGLSFDAALDRVLDSQPRGRPLGGDLRLFQLDIVAGRSRPEALIRLRDRVDVPWFSIFVSALIHAEQIGAGLARTLKLQAEDLRVRRRERALERAMQVPVKLVFPLVLCFLPGIFVATLGPITLQLFQSAEGLLRGAGL